MACYRSPEGQKLGAARIVETITNELQKLGLGAALPGGEGVRIPACGGNGDQSTLPGSKPQSFGLSPELASAIERANTEARVRREGGAVGAAVVGAVQIGGVSEAVMAVGRNDPRAEPVTVGGGQNVRATMDGEWAPLMAGAAAPVAASGPVAWPGECELTVLGWCANPKLVVGRLRERETGVGIWEGRRVGMWRGPRNWKVGQVVKVRLDKGGGEAVYMPV